MRHTLCAIAFVACSSDIRASRVRATLPQQLDGAFEGTLTVLCGERQSSYPFSVGDDAFEVSVAECAAARLQLRVDRTTEIARHPALRSEITAKLDAGATLELVFESQRWGSLSFRTDEACAAQVSLDGATIARTPSSSASLRI